MKIAGKVLDFDVSGFSRKYIVGAMRYGNMRTVVGAETFDSKTGQGEQRAVIAAHAKKLKRDMALGKFSPTTWTIGTRDFHRKAIKVDKNQMATLEVDEKNKLPLLDGNNRTEALELLRVEGGAMQRTVDNQMIPYLLYLDGDTREDFITLQAGRPVSRDHILSVRISTGLVDSKFAPYYAVATEAAQILHSEVESFCHNLIQFDSKGVKLPLSLNTLCSKSASDLAFSLYGGAKIACHYLKGESVENQAKWLSKQILEAYNVIKGSPSISKLLENGYLLSPIPKGTKAGTTMLLAIGNMLAARLMLTDKKEASEDCLDLLHECVETNLGVLIRGNSSADKKRELFNPFCVDFFEDLVATSNKETISEDEDDEIDVPKKYIGGHEGIPIILITLLSQSTFNVSKIPSEGKKRGRKKKQAEALTPEGEYPDYMDYAVDVDVDETVVDSEDPIDKQAFANLDLKQSQSQITCEEEAPWDTYEEDAEGV